jgi:hypothetical protein
MVVMLLEGPCYNILQYILSVGSHGREDCELLSPSFHIGHQSRKTLLFRCTLQIVVVSLDVEEDIGIQQPVRDISKPLVALRGGGKRDRAFFIVVCGLHAYCQRMLIEPL